MEPSAGFFPILTLTFTLHCTPVGSESGQKQVKNWSQLVKSGLGRLECRPRDGSHTSKHIVSAIPLHTLQSVENALFCHELYI